MQNTVNPKSCPFCNNINNCMIKSEKPCWCTDVVIPAKLIAMVPAQFQQKSCICVACINLFNENPENFESKYSLK